MAKARLGGGIFYPAYISNYGNVLKRFSSMSDRFLRWKQEIAERGMAEFRRYMRWRYETKTLPKALCCGGPYYFFIEGPGPWVRHDGCERGVLRIMPLGFVSFYLPPRLYSREGWLVGTIRNWTDEGESWNVEPMNYFCPLDTD